MMRLLNPFLLLLATSSPAVLGIVDEETGIVYGYYEISIPRDRFQMWSDTSANLMDLAELMGYSGNSWEVLSQNPIEGLSFFEFEDMDRIREEYEEIVENVDDSVTNGTAILEQMGFTEDSYDCWMNHFGWYAWDELEQFNIDKAYMELGWDQEAWESDNPRDWPDTAETKWVDLSDDEKQAAANLCFMDWTWDGYWFDELGYEFEEFLPESEYLSSVEPWLRLVYSEYEISMPRFRFQMWDDLDSDLEENAELMGYDEDSWEMLRSNEIEKLTYFAFEDMKDITDNKDIKDFVKDVDQRVDNGTEVLADMGFDEDSYDCWMNHFGWYSWDELETYDLSEPYEELGWDEDSWTSDNEDDYPDSSLKAWFDLTADEKQAAANLCYFRETWDGYLFKEIIDNSVYLKSVEPWLATPAPAPAPSLGGFCFPETALVTVQGEDKNNVVTSKKMLMRNVQLGDKVLVDQDGTYETVYSFGHYDTKIQSDAFMSLTTSDGKSLTLTPNHMIQTSNKGTIAASRIQLGDSVMIASSNKNEKVTQISKNTRKKGMYAPFTKSGYLVVDDIVVSNYIGVIVNDQNNDDAKILGGLVSHQWVAHAFNAPHRFYCNYNDCMTENYTEEGLSTWIAMPFSLAQRMFVENTRTNTFIKTLGIITFVAICIVFTLLFDNNNGIMAFLLMTLAVVAMMRRRSSGRKIKS